MCRKLLRGLFTYWYTVRHGHRIWTSKTSGLSQVSAVKYVNLTALNLFYSRSLVVRIVQLRSHNATAAAAPLSSLFFTVRYGQFTPPDVTQLVV